MKILITVQDHNVAPRFDLTTEIIIYEYTETRPKGEPRYIILPRKSTEDLCDLIVKEGVTCVICGGIEDNLHKFFVWKKIKVIDSIIGSHAQALERAIAGQLHPGCILPSATDDTVPE
jgi:predicted Fe-Mo cluster-binding NifX family protein